MQRTTQPIDFKRASVHTLYTYLKDQRVLLDFKYEEIKNRASALQLKTNLNKKQRRHLKLTINRMRLVDDAFNAFKNTIAVQINKNDSFDKFSELPRELIQHILSFLTFHEKIKLLAVSKDTMSQVLASKSKPYIYLPRLHLIYKSKLKSISDVLKCASKIKNGELQRLNNELQEVIASNKINYSSFYCPKKQCSSIGKLIGAASALTSLLAAFASLLMLLMCIISYNSALHDGKEPDKKSIYSSLTAGLFLLWFAGTTCVAGIVAKDNMQNERNKIPTNIKNNLNLFFNSRERREISEVTPKLQGITIQ